MSHVDDLKIINKAKKVIKQSDSVREVFDKYNLDINEIDYIPVCFSDIDVSARTEKGIVYLNESFREKEKDIPNYLVHEFTHYAQQTTGDGPTKGSTDDTYLDNEYEQEGFQVQTEYISETKGDDVAKNYVNKVLDYHDVPESERSKRKEQLLQLASSSSKQLKLPDAPLNKTQKELMDEYEVAIQRGPQAKHIRKHILRTMFPPQQQTYVQRQLKELIDKIEDSRESQTIKSRNDRKKEMLQLTLDLEK